MKYIDIHAHLDFSDFNPDRKQILADMYSQSIGHFNIGTCVETSKNSIALADENKHVWAIVGIHPLNTNEAKIEDIEIIESLILHSKCLAIGECGLDFFREDSEDVRVRQTEFFKKQIELAILYKKPLMIHCRNAYPQTLEILESYKAQNPSLHAHFHFFTESIDIAKRILTQGWTLSFTGPITFADYDELVKFTPIESLMIETDAPYASPKSKRGQRNDPRNVIEIGAKIAKIKEISEEELFKQIRENTKRVFGV
jgi:TatD DNase family protein